MKCYGCGRCCRGFTLNYSICEIKEMVDRKLDSIANYDHTFVLKYMRPISMVEMWHLKPDRSLYESSKYPFVCSKFDKTTRTCTAYSYRPFLCERYLYEEAEG